MSLQSSSRPAQQARGTRGLFACAVALVALVAAGQVAIAAPLAQADLRQGGTATGARSAAAVALKGDLSMDEAIDRAQKRFRARVVRAEQVEQGGRVVYVLRLLSDEDGRVFTVRVDARSGAMQ